MLTDKQIFRFQSLGQLDLEVFFAERSLSNRGYAEIHIQLIDAGMIRPFRQVYQWRVSEDGSRLLITPISSSRRTKQIVFTLPRLVDLTPQMVAFFGAYDGDGNKTGEIGFAQNEVHLQEFVFESLSVLFGESFDVDVNILEDTKFFDNPAITARMGQISRELMEQGVSEVDATEKKLRERILFEKYQKQFSGVRLLKERNIRYTVSPLKGARKAGASSFEIIRNFVGSRRALPLLLDIIKSVIKTIHLDQAHSEIHPEILRPSIVWNGLPRSFSQDVIDTIAFIASDRCRYVTSKGSIRYQIVSSSNETVVIRKPNGSKFALHRFIKITPLLCLMLGLYLAEGTTAKERFFTFREQPEELAFGFNSSEEISLDIFLGGLSAIFPSVEDIVEQWLVKIGTKYFAETTSLGEKLGVPVVRGGQKARALHVVLKSPRP